jgi:intein/homing endonuclease
LASTAEDTERQTHQFVAHVKSLGKPSDIMRRIHTDPKLWGQVFCDHLLREEDTGERYGDAAFHQEFYDNCADVIKKVGIYERENGKRGFAGAAPRGHAKCVSADTLVQKHNGSVVAIRDVEPGDAILSLNQATLQFEEDVIVAKVASGRKHLLRITTRTGKAIALTPEHRVFTFDGWKEAGQLTTRDRIASPRITPVKGDDTSHADAEVKLLAYMIAEGALSSGNCSFTNSDPEVIEDFAHCATEMGFSVRKRSRLSYALRRNLASPRDWARSVGIYGHRSYTKRVPDWVFCLPNRQKWLFLEALMVTDGWVAEAAGTAGITLANEKLIDDIGVIFSHVGIITSKLYRPNDKAGAWQCWFGRSQIQYLLDNVDLKQKRDKALRVLEKSGYSLIDSYPNVVKKVHVNCEREFRDRGLRVDNRYDITRGKLQRMIELAPHEEWVTLEGADVFWDAITSIEEAGDAETYDVQVAKNENLITNGLVTHNSTITLICCLWALCEGWKRFIAIFSGTDDQAEKIGMNIRAEFEENPFIKLWYGDICGINYGKKWTTKDFVIIRQNENGDPIESTVMVRGCGASVRGARNRGARPDLVLLDDVDKDDYMRSPTQREWLFTTWWAGQVVPMLHPLRGSILVIGTVLHFDSLLSRILARDSIYETRVWKCYDEEGESIWPERFTTAYLRSLQRENPIAFAFEYLNDPTQTGARPFPPENMRFYGRDECYCDEDGLWWWRKQRLEIIAGVDPAISEDEDACQFAMIVIGVTRDKHNIIIMRVLMDRMDFPAQVDAIGQFADAFPQHRACGIETVNYQKALPQQIRQQLRKKVRIDELKHGSGKAAKRRRIVGISPLFAQGRIWFSEASEGAAGIPDALGRVNIHPSQYPLYQQLIQWPASELEDGVDALATAIEAAEGTPFFAPGTFTGNWASALT